MASIAHRVREAAPEDYPELHTCLKTVFEETGGQKAPIFDAEHWEWQYLRTELPSVIVVAQTGDTISGYCHVLRLPARREGRDVVAGLLQDGGTLAASRGRGVFNDIGKFVLQRLQELGVDFVYGFPNHRSRPTFERKLRYACMGVPVYLSPLEPAGMIGARLGLPRAGALVGRMLLPPHRAWRRRGATLLPGERVERLARFDDTVAGLCQNFDAERSIYTIRSARYLNWRFLDKPKGGYEGWALRHDDEMTAFVIIREAELFGMRSIALLDFGCRAGGEEALIRLAASRLLAAQANGAHLAVTSGTHSFFGRLARLGFFRVPDRWNPRPLNVIVKNPAGPEGADLLDLEKWLITLSDWDVV